ncbi:43131_t:CDS:1, partial [Gigaspora margarita]
KVYIINDLTSTSTLFELKSTIHALSGISSLSIKIIADRQTYGHQL